MNTTVRLKASEITKDWHVIDAAGRPLGRVASEAAVLLRGKHKPTFEPHLDGGDFVIVVNAAQVRVTGNKAEQNNYYSHSGFPGGLKTRSYAVQFARFPERVLEQAIWGMLPKGPLGKKMLKHLKVYKGPKHPHQSQLVGSDRARDAREAAFGESLGQPMKAPRLRPLGGVVAAAPATIEPEVEVQVAAAPAVVAPEKPARARKAAAAPAPAPAPEAPAAEAPAAEVAAAETPAKPKRVPRKKATEEGAPVAEAPAADEAPAPKPRARKKPADTSAEAPAQSGPAESKE